MAARPQTPYLHWMVADPYKMGVVSVVGNPRDVLKAVPGDMKNVRDVIRDAMPSPHKDEVIGRYADRPGLCDAGTTQRFDVDVYVWFPRLPDLPTFVHEFDHAATLILDFCGVDDRGEGNEAHAYLLTSLVAHFGGKFAEDMKKERLKWHK